MYQSCTSAAEDSAAMDGSFQFVEGTEAAPTGPIFSVAVSCPLLPAYVDCTAAAAAAAPLCKRPGCWLGKARGMGMLMLP